MSPLGTRLGPYEIAALLGDQNIAPPPQSPMVMLNWPAARRK